MIKTLKLIIIILSCITFCFIPLLVCYKYPQFNIYLSSFYHGDYQCFFTSNSSITTEIPTVPIRNTVSNTTIYTEPNLIITPILTESDESSLSLMINQINYLFNIDDIQNIFLKNAILLPNHVIIGNFEAPHIETSIGSTFNYLNNFIVQSEVLTRYFIEDIYVYNNMSVELINNINNKYYFKITIHYNEYQYHKDTILNLFEINYIREKIVSDVIILDLIR